MVVVLAIAVIFTITTNWNATQGLAEGTFLRSHAEAATAQEFEAQTMLLQSQLEYAVAQHELTHAIGQTPR